MERGTHVQKCIQPHTLILTITQPRGKKLIQNLVISFFITARSNCCGKPRLLRPSAKRRPEVKASVFFKLTPPWLSKRFVSRFVPSITK
jgi:hypothetical protein